MPVRRLSALLAAVVAVLAGGCAPRGDEDRPEQSAALMLDGRADAIDTGIFLAVARDYDGAEGVALRLLRPAAPADGVRALAAGRARFAVLDIEDLALARRRGRDLVGVMALVQAPLGAVLAEPAVRRPRDLSGRRVALGPRARDRALLAAVVRDDGGDPARVRRVLVRARTGPLAALGAGQVAAATGTWSGAGAELAARRPGLRVFRAGDYGAPAYPQLVLCVTRETLDDEPAVVRATVRALRRGYDEALADPESAVGAVVDRTPGLDRAAVQREFDAVSPAFVADAGRFGDLDPARLRAWARWEVRAGLAARPPDVARAFAAGF